MSKLRARKRKVPNWYLDLSLISGYWEGSTRSYHHTAPINMLYALHQSLEELLTEGPANAYARHKKHHEALVAGLQSLGVEMLVEADYRLPMLNAVRVPKGVDETAARRALRTEHGIEIGAGLGPLAGTIWRVGLMGHTARSQNVSRFLEALARVLQRI